MLNDDKSRALSLSFAQLQARLLDYPETRAQWKALENHMRYVLKWMESTCYDCSQIIRIVTEFTPNMHWIGKCNCPDKIYEVSRQGVIQNSGIVALESIPLPQ